MNHRRLLFLFLSLSFSFAKGQNHAGDCRKYVSGCFMEKKGADTLILFRGLQYWIETDVKHHLVSVYKINWANGCNFNIEYNSRFSQAPLPVQDPLRRAARISGYFFQSASANTITYRNTKDSANTITLTPINDTDAWKYLIDADTLLYTDTSEIKKLYGLPLQNFLDNVPDFVQNMTDTAETRFADYMFSLLEAGDITPSFAFASPSLKRSSDEGVLKDYNDYIVHAFGRLENYEVSSVQETSYGRKDVPEIDNFIFTAKFSKMTEKVKICLSIAKKYHLPLVTINVVDDNPSNILFIDTLTADFRSMLKKHDFKKIYSNSSASMKSKITYQNANKQLTDLFKRGHLDNYALFFQTFSVINKLGYISTGFKCKVNGKTYQYNLVYGLENGQYKLSGLNASVN